jgi:predicted DNA-binding WGR domain protein
MTNTKKGHNKVWCAELYDDGLVITKWGPINGWEKNKKFKKGKHASDFLVKKMIEKEQKNYEVVLTENY